MSVYVDDMRANYGRMISAAMTKRLEVEGKLGTPEEAEDWLRAHYKKAERGTVL